MKTKISRRVAMKGGAAVAVAATVPTVAVAGDGELWALWEQYHALDREASRLRGYDGPFDRARERLADKVGDQAYAIEVRIAAAEPVGPKDRAAQAKVFGECVDCMTDWTGRHYTVIARRMIAYFVRAGGAA